MRRTLLALLVLLAIMLGAGAAGTPVNGDDSIAARNAGINIGTAPTVIARTVATQVRPDRAVALTVSIIVLLLAVTASAVVDVRRVLPDRSVVRWERRATRGPPALVAA
jgi:hypothetical protein